ncbi:InlB B-repeat-containing protein, partial [Candidatus Saccharibacteria bacterium]|nr:InlB B-repeat-containing protein [Candidatus Saccharibacteria bacterium]
MNIFVKNRQKTVGFLRLIILAVVLGAVGRSWGMNSVFATNSTLSMSIDNTTLSLDILPHSTNGDFAKSDNSTISVTTNNYSGYTLSIAASSSTNLAGNNGSIASIGSAVSEADFSADTSTAATNYNGKWGYLPSKLNSSTNTSFQPSPGTGSSGHTLDITSTANATTPNTYTLAIGARVDSNTPTGSYSNTFIVSAVANLINYTITYNKGNTTDTVSGLPNNTTGTISDPLAGSTNVTLSSTTPTRSGKVFNGWCTVLPTAGSPDTCSGTTIASGGTYNLNAANDPAITLYAMWKSNGYTISYNANGGSGSITSQEVTPGSSVALADNAFTRGNYYFKGWATTSGGSVAYRTNQSITPTGDMTLYAVWGSSTSQTLYNIVASLTRGNQTNNTNATTGIKTNPTKATSGVWTYNAST